MGWPWFIQNLWQATSDDGLALFMYGPNRVEAMVGADGHRIAVECDTAYPFTGEVRLTVHTIAGAESTCRFPLYLRVPEWSSAFTARANGRPVDVDAPPEAYLRLEREWVEGDVMEIVMGMAIGVQRWPRNGSASVRRGPLWYSAKISEAWRTHPDLGRDTYAQTDEAWPNLEVLLSSQWNYGLLLPGGGDELEETFEVREKPQTAANPWTVDGATIEISAKARRIPNWQLQNDCFVGELQTSPVKSDQPEETITLIPLGAASLRICCFPVIGDQPHAHEWEAQPDSVDPRSMPVNRFEQENAAPAARSDD